MSRKVRSHQCEQGGRKETVKVIADRTWDNCGSRSEDSVQNQRAWHRNDCREQVRRLVAGLGTVAAECWQAGAAFAVGLGSNVYPAAWL